MTLFWYMLRQLFVATLFAVVALGFVVFPAVAVSAVHKLGGVSLGAVLRYVPMVGVELLPYLLSLGFLLAVVSTFGRLAGDKEWIAIQMAGVHPARLLVPGMLLAVVLGGATTFVASVLSPAWKLEQGNFRNNTLIEAFRQLAPGRTELDFGPFYIGSRARDGSSFVDVQIRVAPEGKDPLVLVAKRATLQFVEDELFIELDEPYYVGDDHRMRVMEVQHVLKLSEIFERRDADTSRAKYRTSGTLIEDLAAGGLDVEKQRRYRFELHRRLALGATFLMFLLVGVPTGLWLRSGGQLSGLGAASLYAFGYYVLSLQLGKGLAYSGQLPAELAAWLAVGIGTFLGAVLTWRWTLR